MTKTYDDAGIIAMSERGWLLWDAEGLWAAGTWNADGTANVLSDANEAAWLPVVDADDLLDTVLADLLGEPTPDDLRDAAVEDGYEAERYRLRNTFAGRYIQ